MACKIGEPRIAAANASFESVILVIMAIRATCPEIIVGDIPNEATIIGPASAVLFANRGAAILLSIAAGPAADGIELIEIELFGVSRAMFFNLLPNPFGIEVRAIGKNLFYLFEAIGIYQLLFNYAFTITVPLLSQF